MTPTSQQPSHNPVTSVPSRSPSLNPTPTPSASPGTTSPVSLGEPTQIANAQYLSDFSGAMLTFTKDTTAPESLNCQILFINLGDFGQNPTCTWPERKKLQVLFGQGWNATKIKIHGDVIRDFAQNQFAIRERTVQIPLPSSSSPYLVVSAVLSGASTIGTCDDITLDATASTGTAGRPFKSVLWFRRSNSSSSSSSSSSSTSESSFRRIPGTGTKNLLVTLKGSSLGFGEHTMAVLVRNWVGQTSNATLKVIKVSTILPQVLSPSGFRFSTRPDQFVKLSPEVHGPSCSNNGGGGGKQATVGFARWSQVLPGYTQYLDINSQSYSQQLSSHKITIKRPEKLHLYLAKNTLKAGHTYAFNCEGYSRLKKDGRLIPGKLNSTFIIEVEEPPVVAKIDGGSEITIPVIAAAANNSQLYQPRNIEMSAASSTDPLGSWTVKWILEMKHSSNYTEVSLPSSLSTMTTLSLPTSILLGDAEYRLTLIVNGQPSPRDGSLRNASAAVTLKTVKIEIPIVKLKLHGSTQIGADGIYIVDTDKKLRFEGSVQSLSSSSSSSSSSLSYLWSVDDTSIDLSNSANLLSKTNRRSNLVLRPGLLAGHDIFYRFTLTVLNSHGAAGSASLSIKSNAPPLFGSCAASPASGVSLATMFRLECQNWIDVDMPLMYRFEGGGGGGGGATVGVGSSSSNSSSKASSSRSVLFSVSEWSQALYVETLLPAGKGGATGSDLVIIAKIRDSFGATTTAEKITISVAENVQINVQSTTSTIKRRVQSGDITSLAVLAAGTSAAVRSRTRAAIITSGGTLNSAVLEEAQRTRAGLVEAAHSLIESNDGSETSALLTPIEMVREAMRYEDPAEISPVVQNSAMDILSSIILSNSNAVTSEAFRDANGLDSSIESLGNIIASSATTTQEVDKATRTSLSARAENTISSLGDALVAPQIEGEIAVEIATQHLTLRGQRVLSDTIDGQAFGLSTGDSVNFSSAITQAVSGEVTILVSSISVGNNYGFYPSNENSTGTLSIQIRQNQQDASVQALSTPITFTIAGAASLSRDDDDDVSGNSSSRYSFTCRYWDTVVQRWSTDGVSSVGVVSGTGDVQCETTHLTTFDIAKGYSVEINTIQASDINSEAFSYRNPVTLFCLICIFFWIIGLLVAYRYDAKLEEKNKGNSQSLGFWRKFNRMRRMRVAKRSFMHFFQMSKWGARRRHPWFSIFMRHEGDFMTSTKRVTVLFVLLFAMMTTCALLMDTEQSIGGLPDSVGAGILSMLLSTPVPIFINYIHRRRVPPKLSIPLIKEGTTYTCFSYLLVLCSLISGEADGLFGGDEGGDGGEGGEGGKGEEGPEMEAADDGDEGVKDDDDINNDQQYEDQAAESRLKTQISDNMKDRRLSEYSGSSNAYGPRISADQSVTLGRILGTQYNTNATGAIVGAAAAGSVLSDVKGNKKKSRNKSNLHARKFSDIQSMEVSASTFSSSRIGYADSVSINSSMSRSIPTTTTTPRSVTGLTILREHEKKEQSEVSTFDADMFEKVGSRKVKRKKIQKPMRCCGCTFYSKREFRTDTFYWSFRDLYATIGSVIMIFGCFFILAVLSHKLRHKYDGWVFATLLAFGQDVTFRLCQLVMVEAIMFFPCFYCCLCFWPSSGDANRKYDREAIFAEGYTIIFQPGKLGFRYDKWLRVIAITPLGQAELLGVGIGMRILSINDTLISNENQCRRELQDAHRIARSIEIVFELEPEGGSTNNTTDGIILGSDSDNNTMQSMIPNDSKVTTPRQNFNSNTTSFKLMEHKRKSSEGDFGIKKMNRRDSLKDSDMRWAL